VENKMWGSDAEH